MCLLQVKIWFQNRRARERRGKDAAVISAAQPLTVAVGGGGDVTKSLADVVEDHHHQMAGGIGGLLSAGDADSADGYCSGADDCSGFTPEHVLLQRFSPSEMFADSRRYVVPPTSVAAMMRARLDCCRPSWTVGFPRHHLPTPVTSLPAVAAAADLLAQLSSNFSVGPSLSSSFSASPVNLLRF